jgi:hypothetical protein
MDAYRDVSLSVESAWPAITIREGKGISRRTRALPASIVADVLAAAPRVLFS